MKIKILIYLLCFVSLVLLFQIFNTNKILNYQDNQIKVQSKEIQTLKETLQQKRSLAAQAQYFSLKEVPNGQNDQDVDAFRERLLKALQLFNKNQPRALFGTPLPKGVMLLEKIHILNKNWLITHFNNQRESGDLLIQYKVVPSGFEFKPLGKVYN